MRRRLVVLVTLVLVPLALAASSGSVLRGTAGDDVMRGGPGFDVLVGRGGDDSLAAAGGGRDTVSCGPGRDVALVDPSDVVAGGCETMRIEAPLEGGVLATFDVGGERFRVWVTNPATAEQLVALEAGEATASIPNGRLVQGPGAGDHNLPWGWHLDPEDIEMADVTIEVCDATPSYVEEHLDELIEAGIRYCAWSAELGSLDDRR